MTQIRLQLYLSDCIYNIKSVSHVLLQKYIYKISTLTTKKLIPQK